MEQTDNRSRRPPPAAPRVETPTGFISAKLEGRVDPMKGGRGVFARERIDPMEALVVWGGEIVTERQLQLLPPAERHRLCLQVETGLFLMTTREGPADWVNHSCEPNGGMCGQIVLVAMRAIAEGEEICFDYAMTDSHPYDEFDCHCGSPICRQRITADDWRRPDLQERYRGFFAPHIARRLLNRGDGWNGSSRSGERVSRNGGRAPRPRGG